MPTGYTAFIEDGNITTGKEFLLLCSRAFGIAMEIRDEPLSVPTPTTFEPNGYYKNRYESAVKRLEAERNISFDDAKRRMRSDYNKRVEDAKRIVANMTAINERYAKVRGQVSGWIPPTENHKGIKKFALEQIDMCVNSDKMFAYYQEIIDTPFNDSDEAVQEYITKYIEYLESDVERAKKSYDEEVERANEKTQFMKEFIESLENL